jgi:hypothetical protein
MTTLKFNRQEKLSRIEVMYVSKLVDSIRDYEGRAASAIKNKLNGIYDGYVYSFAQDLEAFEKDAKDGLFESSLLAYRLAEEIEILEKELRSRLG